MSSRSAVPIAIVAGSLLIIANESGSSGIFGLAIELILLRVSGDIATVLSSALGVLNLIASFGGFSVIGGGLLIYVGRNTLGRFIIGLGAGMGLFGLLFVLGSSLLQGFTSTFSLLIIMSQSLGWIGVILSVVAALLARRK